MNPEHKEVAGLDLLTWNGKTPNRVPIARWTGNGPVWGLGHGDMDGDGKLDAAFTNYDDGTVSLLFGNGDGTFRDGSEAAGLRDGKDEETFGKGLGVVAADLDLEAPRTYRAAPGARSVVGSPDTLVVDKTGTLTEGKPKLVTLEPAAGIDEQQLLAIAAQHLELPVRLLESSYANSRIRSRTSLIH